TASALDLAGRPLYYLTHFAPAFRILFPTLVAWCVKQPVRVALPGRTQQTDLGSVAPRIGRSQRERSKCTWQIQQFPSRPARSPLTQPESRIMCDRSS